VTQLTLPITFGHLVAMAGSFRRPGIPPSSNAMQYEMAAVLLRAYVGDVRCDENLLGHATEPYLKPRSAAPVGVLTVQARIAVFSLQDVEGGRKRISRIANSSGIASLATGPRSNTHAPSDALASEPHKQSREATNDYKLSSFTRIDHCFAGGGNSCRLHPDALVAAAGSSEQPERHL